MTQELYEIEFPIGDWSDDGHGKCEYFVVMSPVPVETLRETHFAAEEKFGFKISDIAGKCEDNSVNKEIIDILQKNNIIFGDGDIVSYDESDDTYRIESAKNMCELWLRILAARHHICTQLRIKAPEKRKSIVFSGYDNQGRHIGHVGYGVFDIF